MQTLYLSLTIYGLTIGFALVIAAILHGLGILIPKLKLDRDETPLELAIPSSDNEKEEAAIALAIAVATAARAGRMPLKSNSANS